MGKLWGEVKKGSEEIRFKFRQITLAAMHRMDYQVSRVRAERTKEELYQYFK